MLSDRRPCENCREPICIFLQFEADVIGLQHWHQQAAALENNQARRKHAFCTYHWWSRGIGGERVKLERCVVIRVRFWYPDSAYMGFYKNEDQSLQRRAINMCGNEINAWWEFINGVWALVFNFTS